MLPLKKRSEPCVPEPAGMLDPQPQQVSHRALAGTEPELAREVIATDASRPREIAERNPLAHVLRDVAVHATKGLGAEGAGLRHLTRQRCDWLVRLPSLGSVESLNVSVATGMLLYEAVRQRIA